MVIASYHYLILNFLCCIVLKDITNNYTNNSLKGNF